MTAANAPAADAYPFRTELHLVHDTLHELAAVAPKSSAKVHEGVDKAMKALRDMEAGLAAQFDSRASLAQQASSGTMTGTIGHTRIPGMSPFGDVFAAPSSQAAPSASIDTPEFRRLLLAWRLADSAEELQRTSDSLTLHIDARLAHPAPAAQRCDLTNYSAAITQGNGTGPAPATEPAPDVASAGDLRNEAARQNMELVIARLVDIGDAADTADCDLMESSARDALPCARAVLAHLAASPAAEKTGDLPQVDWLGLALDLEHQAKRVESQTVERAMTAAAHGLRLVGVARPTAADAGGLEEVHQWRMRTPDNNASWHDAPKEWAYERVDGSYEARTLYRPAAVGTAVRNAALEEAVMLCESDDQKYEIGRRCATAIRTLNPAATTGEPGQSLAGGLEQVRGDLLPPIGAKVLIHLGRQDEWVEHTVAGYYALSALAFQIRDGEKDAHRVFVRVIDSKGYENARLLSDVRPAITSAAAPTDAEGGAA